MLKGMRICREIGRQPALKPFVVEEMHARRRRSRSDAALRDYLRATGVSNLHPVGTCRMGHGVDDVVDPQLRVPRHRGPARRRRLDHAVSIVAGNTNAPSIMIGEKCADMVKADAR